MQPLLKCGCKLLILPLLLLPFGCQNKESIPPDVIARLGDRMITTSDFKRYLERNAGTDLAQIAPAASSALLDQYVEEQLISEYAAQLGAEVPAEKLAAAVRNDPGSTVEEKRDELRRDDLMRKLSMKTPPPDENQVQEYYLTHAADFRFGDRVRVRQILVHDQKLATAIEDQLRKGASFDELSQKHSVSPNAKSGGDIGFIGRGELPPLFEEVIFELTPGQTSKVIQTESSFHIFQVEDRKPAGMLGLEAAAPVIRERLTEESLRGAMMTVISDAKSEIPVSVLTKRLPFRYSGTLPTSNE